MSYFKPWRRKIGVLTLVMACMVTAGWVRSLSTIDMLAFPARLLNYTLVSGEGSFGVTGNFVFNFRQVSRLENGREIKRVEIIRIVKQPNRAEFGWWKFEGVEFRLFRSSSTSDGVIPMIPYWSIVIPLTVISAYLLLSKPRTKKSPGTVREIIPPTSTEPDNDPAIPSVPEVAADH